MEGRDRTGIGAWLQRAKGSYWKISGREVTITHPAKLCFKEAGITKLDLVRYYLEVAEGALRGVGGRPMQLKRYVDGIGEAPFYQKRAPAARPPWIEVVELAFPSGRTAEEVVVRDPAQLAWVVNLGCIDLHPHPVRAEDLGHPDELRIDLDPGPGVGFDDVRRVALVAREVLVEHGLTGFPKTSGSRGLHVLSRFAPRFGFAEVRQAALALAREVERRVPALATSKWWKEERHGVFVDYNQNAKDRTVASAYSVRPRPDARVSTPVTWEELPDCDPADFTLRSVPQRVAEKGDSGRGARPRDGLSGGASRAFGAAAGRGDGGCALAAPLRSRRGGAAQGAAVEKAGESRREGSALNG